MRRFIQTSKYPLEHDRGGPLVVNHLHLRKLIRPTTDQTVRSKKVRSVPTDIDQQVCGLSYVKGMTSAKGESMLGHHIANVGDGIPRTLFVADEASAIPDEVFSLRETWADRSLIIGNAIATTNYFKRAVKEGDIVAM